MIEAHDIIIHLLRLQDVFFQKTKKIIYWKELFCAQGITFILIPNPLQCKINSILIQKVISRKEEMQVENALEARQIFDRYLLDSKYVEKRYFCNWSLIIEDIAVGYIFILTTHMTRTENTIVCKVIRTSLLYLNLTLKCKLNY